MGCMYWTKLIFIALVEYPLSLSSNFYLLQSKCKPFPLELSLWLAFTDGHASSGCVNCYLVANPLVRFCDYLVPFHSERIKYEFPDPDFGFSFNFI